MNLHNKTFFFFIQTNKLLSFAKCHCLTLNRCVLYLTLLEAFLSIVLRAKYYITHLWRKKLGQSTRPKKVEIKKILKKICPKNGTIIYASFQRRR